MKYCSVNGQQQKDIAITDRGLAYGDGLFTTAKIFNGKIVLLDMHLERLRLGCQRLHFSFPLTPSLQAHLISIAKDYTLAVVKIMVTTGSGGRGYSRVGLHENATNIIVIVSDFPKHYIALAQHGIDVGDSEQSISMSPILGGLKHLNRLEQVLLRDELDKRKEDDLIVTNYAGNVIEATSSNLFYWIDEQCYTPEISVSGVDGLIRQSILMTDSTVKIGKTKLNELKMAQEMCICNALMGIIPVKSYNGRQLTMDKVYKLQRKMKTII